MMKLRIRVTQDDIDCGAPGDAHYCPIALSIKDRGYADAYVADEIIITNEYGYEFKKDKTPDNLLRFMNDYDTGQEVEPFECDLDLDEEGIR